MPLDRAPALPTLRPAPHRRLCTDCGLSRSAAPELCGKACQFIRPDYPGMERRVHGRARDPERGDEAFFGPYRKMVRARLDPPADGAQWTGIATGLAAEALRNGAVDAVLTVGPHPEDRWRPEPRLVTEPDALAECRGMRMGYAPILALLEPARAAGIRRIAIIGIPCQVYALRSIEAKLGFDALYVIGTPCSDNTTTENFHLFLNRLTDRPEAVTYLEFRADYRVEMRFEDGGVEEIPFLNLPIADLPSDFFPTTCRTCVDYTNALADITVGYMAGDGEQWVIVRNERGARLLATLRPSLKLSALESSGNRRAAVKGFVANTARAAGGLPLRRIPRWLRPLVSTLQARFGPSGLEFARARVEMKAAETVLHLRRSHPKAVRHMVPDHVWRLVAPYGLRPSADERKPDTD